MILLFLPESRSASFVREIFLPAYFFSVFADCAANLCRSLLAGKGVNSSFSSAFSDNLAVVTIRKKIKNALAL